MRLINYPIALILILFFGCLVSCDSAGDSALGEANVAFVNKYIDAVESADFAAMESMLSDDYLGMGPSLSDSIGKEAAVEGWKMLTDELYESIEHRFRKTAAFSVSNGPEDIHGNWVTSWTVLRVKYKNGLGPVDLYVNAVYKIEDGKIARSRTFYNEADVMRQLGYTFVPPLIDIE